MADNTNSANQDKNKKPGQNDQASQAEAGRKQDGQPTPGRNEEGHGGQGQQGHAGRGQTESDGKGQPAQEVLGGANAFGREKSDAADQNTQPRRKGEADGGSQDQDRPTGDKQTEAQRGGQKAEGADQDRAAKPRQDEPAKQGNDSAKH